MQYTIATILGLAAAALAQTAGFDAITSPAEGSTLQAGETFQIVWEAAPAELDNELIDIVLLAGATPSTLSVVEPPIAKGLKNSVGKFDWEIPADLGKEETYGFKILLESDPDTFQFSFPFAIEVGEGGSNSNSTSSSTSSKPTSTSSEDEAETSSADVPKTTLYTAVDEPTADAAAPTPTPTTKAEPGVGPQVAASVFAVLGGLVVAALGL